MPKLYDNGTNGAEGDTHVNHGKYVERPHVPLFILIELWIGFSKYDLTKTQSRIMPGVSKLAALLKRLLREVNYTA